MRRIFSPLFKRRRAQESAEEAAYLRTYECFRQILAINDSTLQLIADIDDRLLGQGPFNLEPLFQRIRKAVMEIFLMINNLNEIAGGRFLRLHDALGRLQLELEAEIGEQRPAQPAGYVVPLSSLRASDAWLAGSKMANLGEVRALGFPVPEGFVITTEACRAFMSANRLWDKTVRLECLLDAFTPALLDIACREVQQAILSAPIPQPVRGAIDAAYHELAGDHEALVAMRSSAVGENASFAGKYYTELNVTRGLLEDSYRTVLASMFSADAILYRFERGLNDGRNEMAVGCIRMVEPRASGIMFSRAFDDVTADRIVISSRAGLNVGITAGLQGAEEIVVGPDSELEGASRILHAGELLRLREIARALEAHFGGPQDIEWAVDRRGTVVVLQCRPMVFPKRPAGECRREAISAEPLLAGGMAACPGAGSGPVYVVQSEADLERFPAGGVLVARHSSPVFSRVMSHCSAIITEIGSPIGHMAILAREFGVPSVVGMKEALSRLAPGEIVTVDATNTRVYAGNLLRAFEGAAERFPLADSPVVQRLKRVARLVTPLHLSDPAAPEFRPANCRSLHDITRFVHEKVYEVMFHLGDRARSSRAHSFRLEAHLPLEVRVLDLGGGIARAAGTGDSVRPSDIVSVPMQAFLEGLLDPRIAWDQPRPVSARGFMSVMGENIAGPPALSRGVGGASFAVISDRYMNFSTKAGYHFSTLDVYCGQSQNKNYIHFKFHGGGAAMSRRLRRIAFLAEVLAGLEFKVQTQGDYLTARLDKYERDYIRAKLVAMGRLTMCVRQLDMLMDSDAKASALAQAFLRSDFSVF
jgi:pyruvate,water dikinase